jgi:cob(I)alamin adenosyltransferase
MVKLNKIYTKTGDEGTTGLGTGERVSKTSTRIAAYGTVDETNAAVGMARVHLAPAIGQSAELASVDAMLARIQNDLFDLGADLCVPDRGEKLSYEPLRMSEAQVERLEAEIDEMNAGLSPLRSFVLPAGAPAATALHVARTVSRRAERLIVELSQLDGEPVSPAVMKYINRLSDHFFVASRYVNHFGPGDVLWVPGGNKRA